MSVKLNIIAYIHTNRIHKYLSVRTKRSKFPRFFLLVPNSQEKSSPKKLASIGGKILARLAPSHLAEEISAGYVIERHTYIGTVTYTCSLRRFTGTAHHHRCRIGISSTLHSQEPHTRGHIHVSLAQTDRQCGPVGNKEPFCSASKARLSEDAMSLQLTHQRCKTNVEHQAKVRLLS